MAKNEYSIQNNPNNTIIKTVLPTTQQYLEKIAEISGKPINSLYKELQRIVNKNKKSNKDYTVPQQYNIAFAELYNRFTKKKEFSYDTTFDDVIRLTSSDDKIVRTNFGILHIKKTENGETVTKVYEGTIIPKEKLIVDGESYFRYDGDISGIDNIENIISRLKENGGVLNNYRLKDAINAIFTRLDIRHGYSTFGVYNKEDNLFLCEDSMPVRDLQKNKKVETEKALHTTLTKSSIKPYFDVLPFWHDYEMLPNFGLAAISPFTYLLRKHDCLIPIPYNYSDKTHLGKSLTQKICSFHLFGSEPFGGDDIKSTFRFAAIIDSICAFTVIDEADNVDFSKLSDTIKKSAERPSCGIRGRPNQRVKNYSSRACLGINANRFRITDSTVLVRILKIPFDKKQHERRGSIEHSKKILSIINQMKPIGWELTRLELERVEYDINTLVKRIRDHEQKFSSFYDGWTDPRRITSWAVCYEGLKMWELAAEKTGCEWRAPTYVSFINNVIKIIEEDTADSGDTPLSDFLSWWEMWKTEHTVKTTIDENLSEEIKGLGTIFARKTLTVDGTDYRGDVVTTDVLSKYQKQREYKLDSLKEIGDEIKSIMGIDNAYRTWKIGDKAKRGCFIPDDLYEKIIAYEESKKKDDSQLEVDLE